MSDDQVEQVKAVQQALIDLSAVGEVLSAAKLVTHPALLIALEGPDIVDSIKKAREAAVKAVAVVTKSTTSLTTKTTVKYLSSFLVTEKWMHNISVGERFSRLNVERGLSQDVYYRKRPGIAMKIAQEVVATYAIKVQLSEEVFGDNLDVAPRLTVWSDEQDQHIFRLLDAADELARSVVQANTLKELFEDVTAPEKIQHELARTLLLDDDVYEAIFSHAAEIMREVRYFDELPDSSLIPISLSDLIYDAIDAIADGNEWDEYIPAYLDSRAPIHPDELWKVIDSNRYLRRNYENLFRVILGARLVSEYAPELGPDRWRNRDVSPTDTSAALVEGLRTFLNLQDDEIPFRLYTSTDITWLDLTLKEAATELALPAREALIEAVRKRWPDNKNIVRDLADPSAIEITSIDESDK